MAEIKITDESLASLKDKVVVVTGGSSGIGLATVQLLLSLGASVVDGDLNPPVSDANTPNPLPSSPKFHFHAVDVTSWSSLISLYKTTLELHGHIDHVFANAGVVTSTDYVNGLEVDDETGDPREPSSLVLDVNLKGVINTAALGVWYIRKGGEGNGKGEGSVVLNASSTGLQRLRIHDYAVSKHGVIGLMRGMHASLSHPSPPSPSPSPIRINAVAPSWTATGMVIQDIFDRMRIYIQPASAVARGVAKLMADDSHRGHLVHIDHEVYKEADEAVMLPAYYSLMHKDTDNEDEVLARVRETALGFRKEREEAEGKGEV
ncbi:short chain dehydrogenase [Nemania sp. FL0916]|nr:short chain dehydrogenase [Nemania sp. FL0916]